MESRLFEGPWADGATMYEAAKRGVSLAGYKFDEFPDKQYLVVPFAGDPMSYSVAVFCGVGYIAILAELPLTVAEEKESIALAHLNAESVGRPLGSYQIQKKSRKVGFKIGLYNKSAPPDEMIGLAVNVASTEIQAVARETLKWVSAVPVAGGA